MNVNKYFITFEIDAPEQREVNSPKIVRILGNLHTLYSKICDNTKDTDTSFH